MPDEIQTGEEEAVDEEQAPAPTFMTAEQVQAMMDRQAQTLTQGFQQTLTQLVQQPHEEPKEEPIQAPSHAQMKAALDEGDWDKYIQLQAQRETAVYQATQRELQKGAAQLRSEGSQWIQQTNKRMLDQQVPDYKKYQKDVDALANELGIDPVAASSPQVVEMLTNTVRGRPENMEKEFQARMEAERRQANGDGTTSDVGSVGRSPVSARGDAPQVFSSESQGALSAAGRTNDEFAKKMGYESWADYESKAAALYSDDTVTHKWRRKQGGQR